MNEVFRSKEELYFSWYLQQLIENGYVLEFCYEPRTFLLVDPIYKKGKKSPVQAHPGTNYTPDFLIRWTQKAIGIFIALELGKPDLSGEYPFVCKDLESWIDVKGIFKGAHNVSAATFPVKRNLMYHVHEIYVQKIIPVNITKKKHGGLFPETFTPDRYFRTDQSSRMRKFNYIPKTLNVFLGNK